MRRRAAVAAVVGSAALAAVGAHRPVGPAAAAAAVAEHRAVVVVDTGPGQDVRRICVRFTEDFISGAELLVRARPSLEPVFREYSGKGKAVCALCGVGCPADDSCLTCSGDGTYWTYSRAPKGSTRFTPSGAGASSTQVRDGDVEGWRWSKGLVPAYVSVEQVCGPAPGDTSTTTAAAAAVGTTTPTPTTAATGTATTHSRREAGRVDAAGPTSTTTSTGSTPLVAVPTSTTGPSATLAAPPPVPAGRGTGTGGGSALPLLGVAALVAGLLGWAAWLRRTRRRMARSVSP